MEVISVIKRRSGSKYQPCITVTLDTQTVDGESWYIAKFIDNGTGWSLDNMPTKNYLRLTKSKAGIESIGGIVEYHAKPMGGSVTTVKIPSRMASLESLKQLLQYLARKMAKRFESSF